MKNNKDMRYNFLFIVFIILIFGCIDRKNKRDENVKNQHYHHMKYAIVSTILFPFIPVASFWLINLLFIVAHLGTDKESRFMNLDLLYPLMWGAEKHRDHHLDISKKKMHNLDLIYYTGRLLDTSV
jgi:hypothetical protein